jgi:hypothetical protein
MPAKLDKQADLYIEAAALGYPRNAKGEFGRDQGGAYFTAWQAEWHKLDGRYQSIDAQFGIVELEDGTWLEDLNISAPRHATRDLALRAAVQNVLDRINYTARPYANSGYVFSPRVSVVEANAIIEWASSLIGIVPVFVEEAPPPKNPPQWADLPLFAERVGTI